MSRVLATEEVKNAIRQLQSIINGGEFHDTELDQVQAWSNGAGYPGYVLDPQP